MWGIFIVENSSFSPKFPSRGPKCVKSGENPSNMGDFYSSLYYVGKVVHKPKTAHTATEPQLEYYYSPLDGMLVNHRVTPSSLLPVPIYTPGWRGMTWSN